MRKHFHSQFYKHSHNFSKTFWKSGWYKLMALGKNRWKFHSHEGYGLKQSIANFQIIKNVPDWPIPKVLHSWDIFNIMPTSAIIDSQKLYSMHMPLYSAPYVRITLLMLFCKCPVNSLWFLLQWPCPITISKIFCKSRNLLLAPSCTEQQQKCKCIMVTGGAASGGRGSFPLPFFENGKKCPNFGEKNALIVFISYLKCCLKSIEEKKLRHFSLLRLPFLCCRWNVYVNKLFSRNLPCHEEFLVRPLVKKAALLWSFSGKIMFARCKKRFCSHTNIVPTDPGKSTLWRNVLKMKANMAD